MTIKLDDDRTISVVITCTDCPWWSALRLSRSEAHTCAVDHERVHHPGQDQAWEAARRWRRRQRERQA